MKQLVIAFILLISWGATAQVNKSLKDSADIRCDSLKAASLSVHVSLVGEGRLAWDCRRGDSTVFYFGTITVTNMGDTPISCGTMICSWPVDNFKISKGAGVWLHFCGCDANFPDDIKLEPRQSVDFHVAFRKVSYTTKAPFKVGFIYYPRGWDWWNEKPGKNGLQKELYWSNEVVLEDKLNTYEVRELPVSRQ